MTEADPHMKPSSDLFDVVVVGYGPVGATLANLLVQQGLSVAILDREASVYHLARAGHFDAEIMRVFQSIGVADEMEPKCGITTGMRWLDADGALLMEWQRGGAKGPNGWVSDYMFHQPDLEHTLRARLATSGQAKSFLLHDVYEVKEQDDHVVVRAEDTANARLVEIRGRYVVGCDGARSLVRRLIGSEHEDLGFKQRWLVVDVRESRDLGLERVSTQHCNPARPMFASATSNGMLRWEIMVMPGDDVAQMTREKSIWDFIENSVRPIRREDGEITRAVVYTFESLIALRWRSGRLLIAGDSAHRTPPFLGQGMCAGVRDAANLAWKLAAVCQGRASETLLDTYETERLPHVRAFIQGAIDSGRIVQMADPAAIEARTRDMRANPKAYAPPNPALGAGVGAGYGEGGLGRQCAQPLIDGKLMDDHIGHSFAVVSTAAFAQSHATLVDQLKSLTHLRWVVLPDDRAQVVEGYGAPGVLLRPDRYLHAVIDSGDALRSTLDTLPVELV
jgi:3-(3-hydroxy-phenyl)propionate hydroxylase